MGYSTQIKRSKDVERTGTIMMTLGRVLGFAATLIFVSACGGGGGGSGDSGGGTQPPTTFTVSTSTTGTGSGTLSPTSRSVTQGSTTSFTISPTTGSSIAGVSGCGGSLSGSTYTTGAISSSCTVTAIFDVNTYTVNATGGQGGSVTPTSVQAQYGEEVTFILAPESGFRIGVVSGCSGSLSQGTFTTDPVEAECDLIVDFVPMGALADTGQFYCGDGTNPDLSCPVSGFPGQDGEYGRDALARSGLLAKIGAGVAGFDFTKLGADGEPLPIQSQAWSETGHEADGVQWSCVRDNYTGLIWEVKTASGLRGKNNLYSWYSTDPNTNGGFEGSQNLGSCVESGCDTDDYVRAINELGLCGANDWRMPTRLELNSIRHLGQRRGTATIDLHFFPNSIDSDYWSGSSMDYATVRQPFAYALSFRGGWSNLTYKSSLLHVRLVRDGG